MVYIINLHNNPVTDKKTEAQRYQVICTKSAARKAWAKMHIETVWLQSHSHQVRIRSLDRRNCLGYGTKNISQRLCSMNPQPEVTSHQWRKRLIIPHLI